MTNDTEEDIVISRCPFIDARFIASDGAEVSDAKGYRTWLNCPAAPDEVEPGDTLSFEIVVPLEGESGVGRTPFLRNCDTLTWIIYVAGLGRSAPHSASPQLRVGHYIVRVQGR